MIRWIFLLSWRVLFFLIAYFNPRLLWLPTIPAGGDTPSHFTAAVSAKEFLFDHFQLGGWEHGNLAGYPLFQYYFPAPFVACALISLVLPITISFKIVTLLGCLMLPWSAFYFLRRLRIQFPGPLLGAVSAVLFLFVESQTIWGGNILSTLAGEFSYSWGMALALFYLGRFRKGISSRHGVLGSSVLLALVGFSHGCALLVAVLIPLFWTLRRREFYGDLKYYIQVNGLAFLWLAFWLVPWLATQDHMTDFNFPWVFHSWASEFLSPLMVPLYVLSCAAILTAVAGAYLPSARKLTRGLGGLSFGILIALFFFEVGPYFNVVDVRFIPFAQLFVALLAGAFAGRLLGSLPVSWASAGLIVVLSLGWISTNTRLIPIWVEWNFDGLERKPHWSVIEQVANHLEGSTEDPRVAYEHSPSYNQFGSIRVFESLPLLSGRSTLEGAYLQSSLNSPFIYYLQSQISDTTSCPLPEYFCASLDLSAAIDRLRLFDVSQLILRSPAAVEAASAEPNLELETTIPPLQIYRLRPAPRSLVVPVRCDPILYTGSEWRSGSYGWFRHYTVDSVPVVIEPKPLRSDLESFSEVVDVFPVEARCEDPPIDCLLESSVGTDRISITTQCPGTPLIVKISHHPRWKVRGAARIYLTAPAFMLIIPDQPQVELVYGWSASNYAGALLTLVGISLGLWSWGFRRHRQPRQSSVRPLSGTGDRARPLRMALVLGIVAVTLGVALLVPSTEPNVLLEKGLQRMAASQYEEAIGLFRKARSVGSNSSPALRAQLFQGVALHELGRYKEAEVEYRGLIEHYPDSRYTAETMYHLALTREAQGEPDAADLFQRVAASYPRSEWARFSRERLRTILFETGLQFFDKGETARARNYFDLGVRDPETDSSSRAKYQYYLALSDFQLGSWKLALQTFEELIRDHPDSRWTAEALYHTGLCLRAIGNESQAKQRFVRVIAEFPSSRWAPLARQRLEAK